MRAIVIDPFNKEIATAKLPEGQEGIEFAAGTDLPLVWHYANGDSLYADPWNTDEVMRFRDADRGLVCAGLGVIVGADFSDAASAVADVLAAIHFQKLKRPTEGHRKSPVEPGGRVKLSGLGLITTRSSCGEIVTLRSIPHIEVEVARAWWDAKCGWRFSGRVLDQDVGALIRAEATSSYGPAWYRANRPTDKEGLRRVEEALLNWAPDTLNFGEAAIVPPDGVLIAA